MTSAEKIMQYIDDQEIEIFDFQFINKKLGKRLRNLKNDLENLVKKGFLDRLEKGKYVRRNFNDEYVIGSFLVPNGTVAYWTALHYYGLTEQFANTLFIQSTVPKQSKTVRGVYYKFIKVNSSKLSCTTYAGHGNQRFRITTLEKTILDCLDQPRYSGGKAELYRAIAKSKLNAGKLIDAAKAVNNQYATRKLAFLLELFNKKGLDSYLKFVKNSLSKRYYSFENTKLTGPLNSTWRMYINIPVKDLITLNQKEY